MSSCAQSQDDTRAGCVGDPGSTGTGQRCRRHL